MPYSRHFFLSPDPSLFGITVLCLCQEQGTLRKRGLRGQLRSYFDRNDTRFFNDQKPLGALRTNRVRG